MALIGPMKYLTIGNKTYEIESSGGSVTSVALDNATGESDFTISGSPITSSGTITIEHANSTTAKSTQAVYPITFDKHGHITGSGSAVTIPTASDTYSSTSSNVMTGKGVNAALQTLDSSISATTGQAISAITITDGKIASSTKIAVGDANQNAFSNVKVGNTTIAADTTTDTLELAAGTDITLTPDATNDKVTVAFSNASGYITGITSSDVTTALGYTPYNSTNPNGYTSNTGTVTSVGISNATNGGLSISGSPVTGSGSITVGHSNVLTSAQTTQAVYPIKIDKNGHISSYGSAVTITDEKLKTESVNTGGLTYYPILQSGTGTTTSTRYYSDHFGFATNTTVGKDTLTIGNSSTQGRITLMVGTDSIRYTTLQTSGSNAATVTIPNTDGTLALTSDIPTITLNGSSSTSPSFYAPTTAGTNGYYLKSNGSGAPTWAAVPAGTVTSVGISNATNGGLSVSGSPVTGSGTISVGHSNILTSAQTTQAVYPIAIDKNGHISSYGTAITPITDPTTKTSGQYLKYNGTNWVADNITAGVSDVQINGTSILSSGTANIVTNTAYNASTNKVATMTDINNAMTVVTFTPDGTNKNLIISVQLPSSIQNGNEVNY